MSLAIKVENLGKLYRLGDIGTGTLSHDLNRWIAKIRGKEDPSLLLGEQNNRETKGDSQFVWALQNINFEINSGEVIGIIGKNGAGKSTLLKILSRTTTPSTGSFKAKGRIASLLEVGTGFHPELTGRENVFLNGAIMGMTKKEITTKFDEIVDFSGVERYIDTPVKRYSSGMYVRLAFAVAAHLDPEILIVDEVLAVGDAEFQNKCLGKMKDVSGQGRTVLFVSHNMVAVKSLCNRGILLSKGTIECDDKMNLVLEKYGNLQNNTSSDLTTIKKRTGLAEVQFSRIKIETFKNEIKSGCPITFELDYLVNHFDQNANYEFVLGIWNTVGTPMFMMTNLYLNKKLLMNSKGGNVKFIIESLSLNTGNYSINLLITKNGVDMDFIENAYSFRVDDGDYFNNRVFYPDNYEGYYQNFDMIIE